MAKRIVWKKNHVVNIKLREDLFTLGQMLVIPHMMFFDIFNESGKWEGVDLSKTPILFCVPIGKIFLQNCVENKIKKGALADENLALPKYWIKPNIVYDGSFPFKGGDLIEINTTTGEDYGAKVIKSNLNIREDAEAINKYEMTNLWGDEDTSKRLIHFYENKVDKNFLKEKIFR